MVVKGDIKTENGRGLDASLLKFKKHRISAIRDFPPNCGRSAAWIDPVKNSKTKAVDDALELKTSDGVAGSIKRKCFPRQGISAVRTFPNPLVDAPSVKKSRSSKDLRTSDDVAGSIQKKCLPRQGMSTVRAFPPRRKISSIRDFPPGCGRNAAPVDIVAFRKSLDSTKDMSLKSGLNDKMEQSVKACDKQVQEDKVQAGDALRTIKKQQQANQIGFGVQVKSDGGAKREKVGGVHVREASNIKIRSENHKFQSDSSLSRKVDRESVISGVRLGMQSVNRVSSGMSSKRKFPAMAINENRAINLSQGRQGDGVGSCNDRVIVLSLMAATKSPWRHGTKKVFKTPSKAK